MRTENSSVEKIEARRNALRKIVLEHQHMGKPDTRAELLKELRKKGFSVDLATLYRDRIVINRTNTFIEDIAESEYSAMKEDIYNKFLFVEEQAMQLYRKDWRITRVVTKKMPNGNMIENSTQYDEFRPKIQCLALIRDIQSLKQSALKGDPVNLSFVMLSKKLDNYRDELNVIKRERDTYEKENKELKEKLNKHP